MPATRASVRILSGAVVLTAVLAVTIAVRSDASGVARADDLPAGVTFDSAFWSHWSDGKAEIAGYDLTVDRYGEKREGVAITIAVTETFSESARVKADPGKHPASDEVPTIKLNLIQDFPTGVYDYNLMTSTFVALEERAGRPAGWPLKVSFSSQEWCGQVYQQLLFDADGVRSTSHSYFDGEADDARVLDHPAGGLAEDALWFWARGLAGPEVAPGAETSLPVLRSPQTARLAHVPLVWSRATLSRASDTGAVQVPAGEFQVRIARVVIADDREWRFYVEEAAPHRIVRWTTSDGTDARLLGSERMAYWQMKGPEFEDAVARFGLVPRGSRRP